MQYRTQIDGCAKSKDDYWYVNSLLIDRVFIGTIERSAILENNAIAYNSKFYMCVRVRVVTRFDFCWQALLKEPMIYFS